MKVTLNSISVFAVLAGVISLTFLVAALATDFWYQIDASGLEVFTNHTGSLKSHRGLWRTCQFNRTCLPMVNPFKSKTANMTTSRKNILYLHGAFVILLPLSLIIIVFGGMMGIISVFTQNFCLLLFTGVLFLLGALVTLLGVSIYIAYSAALFKHVASFQGRKSLMENLSIQFGWSLVFAWVSIGAELLTGLAFVLLAKMVGQKRRWDNFI
ncbi:transmembrane protein 114 [Pantherophis guttatus]|uniref:Transmembrane protein 114 n=1 Tax=Pantherophis guttatus TaxID=94885 RepID=A0A6P9BZ46_PANGU|nr:transmembrane protein 114 [Pantherophis guttatus]XP_060549062.1 transmembrane protein 114 [Pantherophis guttatus]